MKALNTDAVRRLYRGKYAPASEQPEINGNQIRGLSFRITLAFATMAAVSDNAVERSDAGQTGRWPDRGGHGKKLVARDPFLYLAAFYAPRGITPDELRRMSVLDRTVLRVGRARYYEEMRLLTAAGVSTAFSPEKEGAGDGEK